MVLKSYCCAIFYFITLLFFVSVVLFLYIRIVLFLYIRIVIFVQTNSVTEKWNWYKCRFQVCQIKKSMNLNCKKKLWSKHVNFAIKSQTFYFKIKFDMYISIWYTKLLRYSNYLSINIPFSHLMLIFDVRISVLMIMIILLLSIKSF